MSHRRVFVAADFLRRPGRLTTARALGGGGSGRSVQCARPLSTGPARIISRSVWKLTTEGDAQYPAAYFGTNLKLAASGY